MLSAGTTGRAALRHPRVANPATITGFQISLERTDQPVAEAPVGRIVAVARLAD